MLVVDCVRSRYNLDPYETKAGFVEVDSEYIVSSGKSRRLQLFEQDLEFPNLLNIVGA